MQSGKNNGERWTGLLVAAGCNAGETIQQNLAQTPADRASNMTMPRRTTTDRETNTTYEQRVDQADRNTVSSSAANTNDKMDKTTADYGAEDVKKYSGWSDWRNANTNTTSNNTAGRQTAGEPSMSGWEAAQNVARQLPASCRIGASTSAFALRLKDGRVATFDDAGNAKIQQKLQSRGNQTDEMKIYRVIVNGNMRGGTITLNSIQM